MYLLYIYILCTCSWLEVFVFLNGFWPPAGFLTIKEDFRRRHAASYARTIYSLDIYASSSYCQLWPPLHPSTHTQRPMVATRHHAYECFENRYRLRLREVIGCRAVNTPIPILKLIMKIYSCWHTPVECSHSRAVHNIIYYIYWFNINLY